MICLCSHRLRATDSKRQIGCHWDEGWAEMERYSKDEERPSSREQSESCSWRMLPNGA